MKYLLQAIIVSVLFVGLTAGAGWGQTKAAGPSIDPQAEKIMQDLNAQKKKDISANFEIVDTMDEMSEAGQMIQYSHMRKLVVSEPKRFWIESTGDITNTTIWKDDTTFTLFDRSANAYAQVPAPGTIDETMDMLLDTYGVTTPLADLLSDNLFAVLMKNVKTCRYLGLHYADGIKCHHIAATQKDIDWQIWIEDGTHLVPRKVTITYKTVASSPQYTAVLSDWELNAHLPDVVFSALLPKDAEKIDFLKSASEEARKP